MTNCPECGHPVKAHKYKLDGETFHCEDCTAQGASCLKVEQDNSGERMWRADPRQRARMIEEES